MEDVAVYYDSGRLAGVLPSMIENAKTTLAEERGVGAEAITEREAIEQVAAAALKVLN